MRLTSALGRGARPGVRQLAGAQPRHRRRTRSSRRLTGDWHGTGEVRAMAGDMRMHWEPVLDGQFHRLSMERPDDRRGRQDLALQGAGVLPRRDGRHASPAPWFDSRGISLPLTGRVTGDTMTIDWGTEASIERGRSSYRLAADALEVTDEVYGKDGKLSVFGRTRLTRRIGIKGTLPFATGSLSPSQQRGASLHPAAAAAWR